MAIDILINSCARIDVLEMSVNTFMERIKSSNHVFRYVLVEDRVDDESRQAAGKKWIKEHSELFDEVIFLKKKAGPGFFFAPAVFLCKSEYFFHLEDDNEFIVDVNIDPIIELMKRYDDVVEIMLSRGKLRPENNLGETIIDDIKLTGFDLFSVATGIFNTKLVKNMIDKIGWDQQLHESGTLTPMSKKLGLRKFVLGHDEKHYTHVGEEKGYRKGVWKK